MTGRKLLFMLCSYPGQAGGQLMAANTKWDEHEKGIDAQGAMLLAFGWFVALWTTLS